MKARLYRTFKMKIHIVMNYLSQVSKLFYPYVKLFRDPTTTKALEWGLLKIISYDKTVGASKIMAIVVFFQDIIVFF